MIRKALILLYDKSKRILFQHRGKDAPSLPDYWAFFGGEIENNESPEEAVKREAIEELEYELKQPKLVMVQKFKDKNNPGTKYVFMEKCDPTKKLNLREGQNMGWFSIAETKKLKIIGHDRAVLKYVKDKY